jgi:aryl-alcohol dehydrogenase-like predicted oxidoreductase
MKYRTIGTDPETRREVSVLSLGAELMGSRIDEATSFAILDRFVEAGGTFIDTSGNYAFWVNGTQGGESEELLGRWHRVPGSSTRLGGGWRWRGSGPRRSGNPRSGACRDWECPGWT